MLHAFYFFKLRGLLFLLLTAQRHISESGTYICEE